MESPVVVDKPPEYHGSASSNNERGFPFDEEEGTGAWSELAARHPDIAVRLRQRPATWARKRRPSSQDAADDFGEGFSGFDRFPFDDIPSEFREHFPSHWNRRFGSREEPQPQPSSPQPQPQPQPQSPQQQTIATQTEEEPGPSQEDEHTSLPNYGLRNTVDLGQKSAADPSLSEADDRNHRSMSAPPDSRANQNNPRKMSGHQEQQHQEFQPSNVRHIPIFVEGRDEPVINKTVDRETHFGDAKPTYASPPPQPHVDREQYFADDVPHGFHHPPNFSRTFGTPFNKGFRQGPQPFVQQKVYPQTAFARGASPQRSQSPKPHAHPEEYYKVPVHHEQTSPRAEPPSKPSQPKPPQKQQPRQQTPPQQPPPKQPTPPPQPKPQPASNDPITQILSIQTDVLNLMTEVENFKGTKKDKYYMFLDEMLTRNLIKLDNIETEGKENIRQARKEAIKCIQKCIAVLEAKADSNARPAQDVEMASSEDKQKAEEAIENGEVEMKETTKEESKEEPQDTQQQEQIKVDAQPEEQTAKAPEDKKDEPKPAEVQKEGTEAPAEKEGSQPPAEVTQPELADTRPDESKTLEPKTEEKQDEQQNKEIADKKKSPKKGTTNVKKRDKSKDKKETKDKDSNKEENVDKQEDKKLEEMQVDGKGDKTDSQTMEVDGAASQ